MILTRRFCFIVLCGINGVYTGSTETDLGPANTEKEKVSSDSSEKVDVVRAAQVAWSQGIVPYYVDPHTYDDIIATRIRLAMNSIESLSCVLFKAIPVKPPQVAGFMWLYITNPDNERDCMHSAFAGSKGHAILILGYECMQRRDIIHSLMHVLGFNDEVTHPQRDMYIRILWQNIQPKYRPLFRINTDEQPHKTVVEYDTMSVMHFHDRAFSRTGGATIAPLISGLLISPSEKLSQLDIMKLRLAFGHECNRRKVGKLFKTCENVLQDGVKRPSSKGHSKESSDNSDSSDDPKIIMAAESHDNPHTFSSHHASVSEESLDTGHIVPLVYQHKALPKSHRNLVLEQRAKAAKITHHHHHRHSPAQHGPPTRSNSINEQVFINKTTL